MGTHTNASHSPIREVMDHLRRIVQILRIASRASERAVGLSAAQLFVLSRLNELGRASINELAEQTATHQSSVSVVVSRLTAIGLVRRATANNDGRKRVLSMTTKGSLLLRKAPDAAQERLIAGLRKLKGRQLNSLKLVLREWIANTGLAEEAPPLFFEERPRSKAVRRGRTSG